MTEEIKLYIEQIRTKVLSLHQQLVIERERLSSVTSEISRLNERIREQEGVIAELTESRDSLFRELEIEREKVQLNQASEETDLAIDGLVKEIDFCIQQLKIANE